jgi:hypothetical protein
MDINKIFGAFNSDKEDDGVDIPTPDFVKKMLDENHPRYFIGMFSKLINNNLSYQKGLVKMFKEADPSFDVDGVEKAGRYMLFSRAWEYVNKFDLNDPYSQHILEYISNKEESYKILKKALNTSMQYFEEQEEYEKCAFLKKLLDSPNLNS